MPITQWDITDSGFSNRGGVTIFPHLQFDTLFTYSELEDIVKDISKNLFINIKIYEKNSYTYELNGSWNVIFVIQKHGYNYPYMIRRDKDCKKSYGCPLIKLEYYSIGERDIRNLNGVSHTSNEFVTLENYLIALYACKKVDTFPSSIEEIEELSK